MGSFSLIHWLILGVVILLLFGKGRFSDMMGDVAKGLKSFKKGMSEDDAAIPESSLKHIGTEHKEQRKTVRDVSELRDADSSSPIAPQARDAQERL